MIQEIANVVFQAAQTHDLLISGREKNVDVIPLADVEIDEAEKWTYLVKKIATREYTTTDDILFDLYGANYQGTMDRDIFTKYDMILNLTHSLLDAKDQYNGREWRTELSDEIENEDGE